MLPTRLMCRVCHTKILAPIRANKRWQQFVFQQTSTLGLCGQQKQLRLGKPHLEVALAAEDVGGGDPHAGHGQREEDGGAALPPAVRPQPHRHGGGSARC